MAAAVAVLAGVLAATTGTAAAWYATPSGHFECVVTDDGFYVGLSWSVTSWQPGDITGVNPAISVEMSRDGGPAETIGVGAFTPDNSTFGGSMIVPEGPGSITLTAYATAPWGDGTVDGGRNSVELYVPTLEEIGDPRCLVKPEKPTEKPTEVPTAPPEKPTAPPEKPTEVPTAPPEKPAEVPSPAPEAPEKPAEAPKPQPKTSPEVTVLPPQAVQPEAEVQAKELARTGAETTGLALFAMVLIGVGATAYGASRFTATSGTDSYEPLHGPDES